MSSPVSFIAPIPLSHAQPTSVSHKLDRPHHCSHVRRSRHLNPVAVSSANPSSSSSPSNAIRAAFDALRRLEYLTRPGVPSSAVRFDALPAHVKTASQMLGRVSPGCEGTAGVFPRCNFGCTPCYHSAGANKVRVDGKHTATEVARQMAVLQSERGPVGHCQLIGGEVSLLPPEDHAIVLEVMRFFGRIPMSFTHGDFDYDYLYRLAVSPQTGRPRFKRLDFAVHFDTGMRGRRGIPNPSTLKAETDLNSHRLRFVQMFRTLRQRHQVRFYLAHNMTITPDNAQTFAPAVRDLAAMGFRLLSFQPAALQGARRVRVDGKGKDHDNDSYDDDDDGEAIWKEIERGIGIRLPYSLFQMGDVRCNRMAVCGVVGAGRDGSNRDNIHVFPFFDDTCAADVRVRDVVMHDVGNIVMTPDVLALKFVRILILKPWLVFIALAWCFRVVARAKGPWNIIRSGGMQPLTVVMHRFMDADDVQAAWRLMQQNVAADDAPDSRIRDTMHRLAACSYGMAHPESKEIVPACVQHAVYDPPTNERLAEILPLSQPFEPACDADLGNLLSS